MIMKPSAKKSIETIKKLKNTRMGAKTPRFFRIIRNIGLGATVAGLIISTAPLSLPAAIVTAGGYLTWIGGTAATISQFAKE